MAELGWLLSSLSLSPSRVAKKNQKLLRVIRSLLMSLILEK